MEIDSKEAIVKIKHMQSNIQNGLNSINLNGNLLLHMFANKKVSQKRLK